MFRALVLSVPGTGSRFTMSYLDACLGYVKISPEDLLHKPTNSPFCALQHVNASPPILRELRKAKIKTVVPLRCPVHQFITRTGTSAHAQRVMEESKTLWSRLRQLLTEEWDFVYLPIEEDIDRRARLLRVSRHLAATPDADMLEELVTRWDKVGSNGTKPERVKYDKTGHVNIGGKSMQIFDEEMAWYQEQIEEYKKTL